VHEKLMDDRLNTALKVRGNLTPEQLKAVSDRITDILNGNFRPRLLRGS